MPPRSAVPTPVSRARLTRSVRASLETEAKRLLRDVGSAKRFAASDRRAIRDLLGPLANASTADSKALRLAVARLDAFRLGFGSAVRIIEGLGGGVDPFPCGPYVNC